MSVSIILATIAVAAIAAAGWLWWKWRQEQERSRETYADYSMCFEFYDDALKGCAATNRRLQDELSAIKCPLNNHVWQYGKCVKCGRMQE